MNTRDLWYLTRGAGTVSLALLTGVVLLGIVTTVRWARPSWPRFASQQLHRDVSLLAIAFVLLHVVTAVTDPFAPLRITDAVLPFLSNYRPMWVGLGAVAFDLLLALVGTSLLRLRIGHRPWRWTHWLAYACWPIAVIHGLGTGSDARLLWFQVTTVACVGSVVAATWWRIAHRWPSRAPVRVVAALASVAVPIGMFTFWAIGPLAPGWARRAGTPVSLLGAVAATSSVANQNSDASNATGQPLSLPSTPTFSGTVRQSQQSNGTALVAIDGTLAGAVRGRLSIDLYGQPLANGGVAMTRSTVIMDAAGRRYTGAVEGLSGDVVSASLDGAGGRLDLELALNLQGSRASGSARLMAAA